MLSIELLERSMGRLYPWVLHAPKVLWWAGALLAGLVVLALVDKT